MKKGIFILVYLISVQTFAQWRSYYPNEDTKKERKNNIEKGGEQRKFNTHFYNGLSLKSLENFEEALEEFKKCIDLNSENPVPYYESAIIYKLFGQVESGLECSKKAYYLSKENIWYQLLYAELLATNGYSVKASIIYKQLVK